MVDQSPLVMRKAGVASAIILAVSVVAAFISLLIYAQHMSTYPLTSVAILAIVTLVLVTAAGWLGREIWMTGAQWPAVVLAVWAALKMVLPVFLYPNVLPTIFYGVAMAAALLARRASKTAT